MFSPNISAPAGSSNQALLNQLQTEESETKAAKEAETTSNKPEAQSNSSTPATATETAQTGKVVESVLTNDLPTSGTETGSQPKAETAPSSEEGDSLSGETASVSRESLREPVTSSATSQSDRSEEQARAFAEAQISSNRQDDILARISEGGAASGAGADPSDAQGGLAQTQAERLYESTSAIAAGNQGSSQSFSNQSSTTNQMSLSL